MFLSVNRLHGFAPIAGRIVNPERQLLLPIQKIQIFQTNLFKGLGGEVVEAFFDVAFPNTVYIVIFQIGQVAVSRPLTSENNGAS